MRTLLTLCCLLAITGAQAQTYRWTDTNGHTVISDTPPGGKPKSVAKSGDKATASDGLPFATKQAMDKYPVTLYTAPDCISECKQARDLLNNRGVPYTEKNIQTPEDLAELKALVGEAFVPTIKLGSTQKMRGFEASSYDNLLDIAGYPKTAPYGTKKTDSK